MAILIAAIILLLILALNIPMALRTRNKFLKTCDSDYKIFQDANQKKFIILFFVILVIAAYFVFQSKKPYFLLAPALMLFLVVGAIKNAMIVTKDKIFFRECAVPLTEITSVMLTYSAKGKYIVLFEMKNGHKFGYGHNKITAPRAIGEYMQSIGMEYIDDIKKREEAKNKPVEEIPEEPGMVNIPIEDDTVDNN